MFLVTLFFSFPLKLGCFYQPLFSEQALTVHGNERHRWAWVTCVCLWSPAQHKSRYSKAYIIDLFNPFQWFFFTLNDTFNLFYVVLNIYLWGKHWVQISWQIYLLISGSVNGCGPPPAITNGSIVDGSVEQYQHGDRKQYECNGELKLVGSKEIECINGQWSSPPSCIGNPHSSFLLLRSL